jgi:hypothetical protein
MKLFLIRDTFEVERDGREGFTLGQLFDESNRKICFTLEDQDRKLEEGNGKVYGKSAIPTGTYELELYNSPKHGLVPLLKNVPGFKYVEIHKANKAEELLGCIAVGAIRLPTGVQMCATPLQEIVEMMLKCKGKEKVFLEIKRGER